jgi:hypothetical protein
VHFGDTEAHLNFVNDTSISVHVPEIPIGDYTISVIVSDSALIFNQPFKVSPVNFYAEKFTINIKNIICQDKYNYESYYRDQGTHKTEILDTLLKSFSAQIIPDRFYLDSSSFLYTYIVEGAWDYKYYYVLSFDMDEEKEILRNMQIQKKETDYSYKGQEDTYTRQKLIIKIDSAQIVLDDEDSLMISLNSEGVKLYLSQFTNEDYKNRIQNSSYYVTETRLYTFISTTDSSEVVFKILKK